MTATPLQIAVALIGAVLALAGGYWDDGWHTERGRDDFFIAPHLAIYGGVTAIGGAVSWWLLTIIRRDGASVLLRRPVPLLGALSVLITLASGPIDNAWHEAFGRDAVIWSPPHMLGIVGTLCLGAALLAEVGGRRRIAVATSGLVLAAAAFSVVEYETDVPQFSSLWYLPVLCFAAAVAFSIIRLARPEAALPCTEAAFAQLVFILLVTGGLLAGGFPAPAVPLLLVPAFALDRSRGRSSLLRAIVLCVVVYAVHIPVRNWLGNGVSIDATDVALGLPLAIAAAWLVFRLAEHGVTPAPRRGALAVAMLGALLVLPASAAFAHDPGQGADAGAVSLEVSVEQERVQLNGRVTARCDEYSAHRIVARRAGRAIRAPMRGDACGFSGELEVDEQGRWFVYAQLRKGDDLVESWLPIDAGGRARIQESARYAYVPPAAGSSWFKYVGGGVLYALMLALLGATLMLLKRAPGSFSDTV